MKSRFIFLFLLFSAAAMTRAATSISAEISSMGDTVHLEMLGRQNWDYDLKKVERKGRQFVDLLIEPVDEKSLANILNFKSEFVKSVTVDKKAQDQKYLLSFEIAGQEIETFDYLTDQPSRLILDFYVAEGVKLNAKKTDKKKENKNRTPASDTLVIADKGEEKLNEKINLNVDSSEGESEKGKSEKPIAEKGATRKSVGKSEITKETKRAQSGVFDGGDPNFTRFDIKDYEIKEEAILRSKDNYYVPFPMLEKESEYWSKLKMAEPIYNIIPKDTDENKQARLLFNFFEKGRYNVYLKTLEWFKEKYKESEYNEILAYMTADLYTKMYEKDGRPGDFEISIQKYKEALNQYPKSSLAERVSLMLGRMMLEKGDSLSAIRLFNDHIENKNFGGPATLSKDIARLGTALAYVKLNRFGEAKEVYEALEKKSEFKDVKHEAGFRRGDVELKAKNFKKAIEDYQMAIKKYPESLEHFPNAVFNQAESLFSLEQYRPSLNAFKDFVVRFPSHEYAAFAMTRMGELLDIMGADQALTMGAYLETYFRYGDNPNSTIARIRLISGRMKSMKDKELESSLKEIQELTKKLDIPHLETFKTIMLAEGFNKRGDFAKATDLLKEFYQRNPTNPDNPHITRRIVGNINEQIYTELQKGDFISALKTHQIYADTWLKSDQRLDTKYFVGRAFEMGGAQNEAEHYYQDVLNKIYSLKGTAAEKNLKVMELLPSEDQLNLRLASVADAQGHSSQAYDYLRNVKNPEKLSDVDQIERVQLAVKLLEKKGDLDSSVRYLTELLRTWKGIPALVARPYLKLSELEVKQGKKKEAIESLRKIDEMVSDGAEVQAEVHSKALENLAGLYLAQGDEKKAIAYYEKLLNQYEDKKPLSSIRYKLGSIFFDKGEVQKAAETWKAFKGKKSEFWNNLAQEQLKNSDWREGYKKYLKRIPAMAEQAKREQ